MPPWLKKGKKDDDDDEKKVKIKSKRRIKFEVSAKIYKKEKIKKSKT